MPPSQASAPGHTRLPESRGPPGQPLRSADGAPGRGQTVAPGTSVYSSVKQATPETLAWDTNWTLTPTSSLQRGAVRAGRRTGQRRRGTNCHSEEQGEVAGTEAPARGPGPLHHAGAPSDLAPWGPVCPSKPVTLPGMTKPQLCEQSRDGARQSRRHPRQAQGGPLPPTQDGDRGPSGPRVCCAPGDRQEPANRDRGTGPGWVLGDVGEAQGF